MYRELRHIYCLLSWQVFPISLSLSSLVTQDYHLPQCLCNADSMVLVSIMGAFVHLHWFPGSLCALAVIPTLLLLPLLPSLPSPVWFTISIEVLRSKRKKYGLVIHFPALLIQLFLVVCPFRGQIMLFFCGLSLLKLQTTHISIASNKTSSIFSLQEIFVNVWKTMIFSKVRPKEMIQRTFKKPLTQSTQSFMSDY